MIKYLIFDVDRTIVDSYEPELLSFQEAMENVLDYKLNDEQIKSFTTLPTTTFLTNINLTNEEINKVMKEWEKTFPKYKTKCFAGIKEVLKELHKKGYILGLITSRTINEYHELDEELKDIVNLFKIVITSDIINNPKPNPESMNYLCKQLNCKNEEIIYIGDSIIDKAFALNSNCYFIPACYDNKELINEENSCLNPKDLPTIVERIIKNTN